MSLARFLREKIFDPIRRAQGSPESIARGGAMGLWVALTPTVGVQSLLVTALAVPMRANLPVSLVMCWITNPITLIPFYFSYYWLGAMLLGSPAGSYRAITQRFQEQFAVLDQQGFVDSMLALGSEILWPMCLGSLVMATAAALPTYHVLLWYSRRRRRRAALLAQAQEAARAEAVAPEPAREKEGVVAGVVQGPQGAAREADAPVSGFSPDNDPQDPLP